nr:immunoglobulin light chain junction region [Macaca mulatta]
DYYCYSTVNIGNRVF